MPLLLVEAIFVPSGETLMLFSSWEDCAMVRMGFGPAAELCLTLRGLEPDGKLVLANAECCRTSKIDGLVGQAY